MNVDVAELVRGTHLVVLPCAVQSLPTIKPARLADTTSGEFLFATVTHASSLPEYLKAHAQQKGTADRGTTVLLGVGGALSQDDWRIVRGPLRAIVLSVVQTHATSPLVWATLLYNPYWLRGWCVALEPHLYNYPEVVGCVQAVARFCGGSFLQSSAPAQQHGGREVQRRGTLLVVDDDAGAEDIADAVATYLRCGAALPLEVATLSSLQAHIVSGGRCRTIDQADRDSAKRTSTSPHHNSNSVDAARPTADSVETESEDVSTLDNDIPPSSILLCLSHLVPAGSATNRKRLRSPACADINFTLLLHKDITDRSVARRVAGRQAQC